MARLKPRHRFSEVTLLFERNVQIVIKFQLVNSEFVYGFDLSRTGYTLKP